MKRNVLTVVLSVTMLFGLTACGKTASLDEIEDRLEVLFYAEQEDSAENYTNSDEYYGEDTYTEYYTQEDHYEEETDTISEEEADAYIQENYPLGTDCYILMDELMNNYVAFRNYFTGEYMYIPNAVVSSIQDDYIVVRMTDEKYNSITIGCYTDLKTIMQASEGMACSVDGYIKTVYRDSLDLENCTIDFYS